MSNGMFVVVCTDADDNVSIWEHGFKTFEDAKYEIMRSMKQEYDCPVLEECDDMEEDDIEDMMDSGEYISEKDLAHYDCGEKDIQYTINYVDAPIF